MTFLFVFITIISEVLSVLFNPLFGGIGKALTTVIAYIIEPDGAWIPFILAVLTSLIDGILIGLLWRALKKATKLPYMIILIIIAVLSIVLLIFLQIKYAVYSSVLIIIFIVSDILIRKNYDFTKLFICITLTGLISALINDVDVNDIIFICCIRTYVVMFIVNLYHKILKKP